MTIGEAYDPVARERWQPLSDAAVVGIALAAIGGAWATRWLLGLVLGAALAVVVICLDRAHASWAWRVATVIVLVCVSSALRADAEWEQLAPDVVGPFDGWVRLIDDPQPLVSATRVIVDVDGQRFEVFARGRAGQLRMRTWRGGDLVRVHGERVALSGDRAARVAWQHVVGELRVEWVGDVAPGAPLAVASNRVRAAIERGSRALPPDDAALFRGLVIGDDRDQPRAMIERFRASGLAHLTAVSGQNVSFVIAAAGPLLSRLRPAVRWAVTIGLIAWFVSLTRFEPSIVRAGTMAAISTTAYSMGRDRAPFRVLCLAVTLLVLVDPLLLRSIGFWLSVGATAGVCTVGPWLARRLSGLGILATPVGITLGAQLGVALPSVLVFGRLPLVSIPANVLAVPVAGFVMLYGLPAALVAGWVPALDAIVMFPARLGVRWVDSVAVVGERVEPHGRTVWLGWSVVVAAVTVIAAKNRVRHGRLPPHR
ncbi:MAG TPA: ComEC/Rec2 family competence protein [Ilumatobacteraceae bacterium]|nr:ComEC/Rec2 family competence protein [Ilumatobacteraceae bacterium]